MKNYGKFLIFISILVSFAACKKNNDSSPSSTINTNVQQGSWRISLFDNKGVDETVDFNGYIFSFASGGIVTAVGSNGQVSGTWATGTDNSTSKLILTFPAVSPFEELNEDWEVHGQSSSEIKLKHVSGGSGDISYLNFEKIK